MNIIEPTPSQAAVVLKKFLATEGHELKLNVAQEAIARTRGFASFQAYVAAVPHRGDPAKNEPSGENPAIVAWLRQEKEGYASLQPALLWGASVPQGYGATYRPVAYADVLPVAKVRVTPALQADERIFTVKLKGTQRQLLADLAAEARELAQIRARDTTPTQQAEQEAREQVLKEALAELTEHARCYEDESSGKQTGRKKSVALGDMLKSVDGDLLFAISGRASGDDDDTVKFIWAKDEDEARMAFKLGICEDSNLPEMYAFEDDLANPIYVCGCDLVGELVNGRFVLHQYMRPRAEAPQVQVDDVDVSKMSLEDIDYVLREEHDRYADDWEELVRYSGGSSFGKMVTSMAKEPGYTLHAHAKRFLELTSTAN